MKKVTSFLKRLNDIKLSKLQLILFVIIFGATGTYLLAPSLGVAPFVSVFKGNSTVTGAAVIVNDANSAAGKVVRFGPDPVNTSYVIAAAGDMACDPADSTPTATRCRQSFTADLITANPDIQAVLPLGDNQYFCGSLAAFQQSYDLSWGAFKDKSFPVVGNHEYLTSGAADCNSSNAGAAGYFDYFGSAAGVRGEGYYSFNIGEWHLIALNSNCSKAGGCGPSSAQGQWLAADLASNTNVCTLAYFHHPVFSQDTSGGAAGTSGQAFWDVLYDNGADIILNGHSHIYSRYPQLDPTGNTDSRGIREFLVGSGGANHTPYDPAITPFATVTDNTTFGVLELTFNSTSYDWEFVNDSGSGSFTDSGSANCVVGTNN